MFLFLLLLFLLTPPCAARYARMHASAPIAGRHLVVHLLPALCCLALACTCLAWLCHSYLFPVCAACGPGLLPGALPLYCLPPHTLLILLAGPTHLPPTWHALRSQFILSPLFTTPTCAHLTVIPTIHSQD